jgi:hypothetical protein
MHVKNILSKEYHTALLDMVTSLDFPWYYQPNIAYSKLRPGELIDPMSVDSFGLVHTVWDAEKGKVSEVLKLMGPVIDGFTAQTGITCKDFIRIKINLQTPIVNNIPNGYNGAHVDRYTPHKTIIYYIDDSDGDTFIFNEIFDNNDPSTHPPLVSPTVKERITPEANSLYYLENGCQYHSSSNPVNTDRRYTINFNFT